MYGKIFGDLTILIKPLYLNQVHYLVYQEGELTENHKFKFSGKSDKNKFFHLPEYIYNYRIEKHSFYRLRKSDPSAGFKKFGHLEIYSRYFPFTSMKLSPDFKDVYIVIKPNFEDSYHLKIFNFEKNSWKKINKNNHEILFENLSILQRDTLVYFESNRPALMFKYKRENGKLKLQKSLEMESNELTVKFAEPIFQRNQVVVGLAEAEEFSGWISIYQADALSKVFFLLTKIQLDSVYGAPAFNPVEICFDLEEPSLLYFPDDKFVVRVLFDRFNSKFDRVLGRDKLKRKKNEKSSPILFVDRDYKLYNLKVNSDTFKNFKALSID